MSATTDSGGNFWRLLEVVARRRGLILSLMVAAAIISVVVAFMLPAWYEAEAVLMPPHSFGNSLGGNVAGFLTVTEGLNLPIMVTPSDVYARMLRSRRVSEGIIDSFDLHTTYQTTGWLETYNELMSHSSFEVTDEGLLTIRVEDKDPQTAAAMANAYVDEINRISADIVANRAKQNRVFIGQRLDQVEDELNQSREKLQEFQQEHKAIDFDEQTRLAIEQAVELKVHLARLEMDIDMARQVLDEDNPDMQEKLQRRGIILTQLKRLEEDGADSSYFTVPVSVIPELKGAYQTLFSRVQVNERLYDILLEQAEQARITVQEQTPTVTVLDIARPPEVRSRPRRSLIVGASVGLALLLGILLGGLFELLGRLEKSSPEDYTRVQHFVAAYFGWLPGVRKAPPAGNSRN